LEGCAPISRRIGGRQLCEANAQPSGHQPAAALRSCKKNVQVLYETRRWQLGRVAVCGARERHKDEGKRPLARAGQFGPPTQGLGIDIASVFLLGNVPVRMVSRARHALETA
jgi:hypothetical protein